MLDQVSFRTKMRVLGVVNPKLIAVLGVVAYSGMSALDRSLNEQTDAVGLLRRELLSDMLAQAALEGRGQGRGFAVVAECEDWAEL